MAEAHHEAMTSYDFSAHVGTYEGFLRIASVGTAWVLGIVATLAIGGTTGSWGLGAFLLIIGTIASIAGLAVRGWGWRPGAAILVLDLLALLLLTH